MRVTEKATVTSKGQVTIPKQIRDAFEIEEGEQIQFTLTEEDELVIRRTIDPMERLKGVRKKLAPLDVDVDELRQASKTEWSTVDGRDT